MSVCLSAVPINAIDEGAGTVGEAVGCLAVVGGGGSDEDMPPIDEDCRDNVVKYCCPGTGTCWEITVPVI